MNKLRLPSCASIFAAAMTFAIVLASAQPAHAIVIGAMGGPGGGPFNLTCPAGQYLVGFHARSGGWVDAVGIICAPYDAATRRLGDKISDPRITGGVGGGPQDIYCPAGDPIKAIGLAHTRGGGLDR